MFGTVHCGGERESQNGAQRESIICPERVACVVCCRPGRASDRHVSLERRGMSLTWLFGLLDNLQVFIRVLLNS